MRGRHVLRLGDEPPPSVLTYMAGHPSVSMEDLDHVGRGAHLHRFMYQLVRHRVVTRIALHVIIDIHLGRLPLGELVARGRQRLQRSAFELLEQRPPRNRLAAERTIIDHRDCSATAALTSASEKNWRLRRGARIQCLLPERRLDGCLSCGR